MNDSKPNSGSNFFGSPFNSAGFQGEVIDHMAIERRNKLNVRKPPPHKSLNSCIVTGRNDNAGDIIIGSVVELADIALAGEQTRLSPWFSAVTPTEDSTEAGGRAKGFGIAIKPIPEGEYGDVQVAGICLATINVTDEEHAYADVADGEDVLQSAASGPVHIFYKPSGTGELTCWIVFGGSSATEDIILFETLEKLPLGGRCRAKRLQRKAGTNDYETYGDEIIVKDISNDSTRFPGSFIAGPEYRGVACLPSTGTVTEMSILGILSILSPFSFSSGTDQQEWSIVWLEKMAQIVEFTLTEDMGATHAGVSLNATVDFAVNGKVPGDTVHIYDDQGQFKRALAGAKGVAHYTPGNITAEGITIPNLSLTDPDNGYVATECQSKAGIVHVTISDDRDPDAIEEEIEATIDHFHGTQQDIQEPTDSTFHVSFYEDEFPDAADGDKFVAIFDSEENVYWVTSSLASPPAQRNPTLFYFPRTLNAAGSNTSGLVTRTTVYTNLLFATNSPANAADAYVQNLNGSASDRDSPSFKLLKAGLWSIRAILSITAGGQWDNTDYLNALKESFTTSGPSTGAVTSHTHTVESRRLLDPYATAQLQVKKFEPGESLQPASAMPSVNVRVPYYGRTPNGAAGIGESGVLLTIDILENYPEDTDIYLFLRCDANTTFHADAGFVLDDDYNQIIFEWIRPRTDES